MANSNQVSWLTLVMTEAGQEPTDEQILLMYRMSDEQIEVRTLVWTHRRSRVTGIPLGKWVPSVDEVKARLRAMTTRDTGRP